MNITVISARRADFEHNDFFNIIQDEFVDGYADRFILQLEADWWSIDVWCSEEESEEIRRILDRIIDLYGVEDQYKWIEERRKIPYKSTKIFFPEDELKNDSVPYKEDSDLLEHLRKLVGDDWQIVDLRSTFVWDWDGDYHWDLSIKGKKIGETIHRFRPKTN